MTSVKAYCQKHPAHNSCQQLEPAHHITIQPINIFGSCASEQACYLKTSEVKIPEKYLAKIHHVAVLGGTEIIVSQQYALYDEIELYNKKQYGVKNIYVVSDYSPANRPLLNFKHELLLRIKKSERKNAIVTSLPSSVISLCKDYSINYFHWLTESLPKMQYIDEHVDPSVPLLIESDHPEQNIEALNYLNKFQRKIYLIQRGYLAEFEQIYYVSSFSHSHENLVGKVSPEDLMLSPEAIHFLRKNFLTEKFLGRAVEVDPQERVKLYVSREDSNYRCLLNEKQIQTNLEKQGFKVVKAAKLSFKEQVQLFSKASMIIGPSGAGMTNLVFAPKDCKVFVLTGNVKNANFYSYGSLAQHAEIYLEYIIGKARHPHQMHSDFEVSLDLITEVLMPTVFEFKTES